MIDAMMVKRVASLTDCRYIALSEIKIRKIGTVKRAVPCGGRY